MNRRGFLGSILAAAVAPAIVRADSLMRIVPTETVVLGEYDINILAGPSYATSIDEFSRLYIEPAMKVLCDNMERDFLRASRRDIDFYSGGRWARA